MMAPAACSWKDLLACDRRNPGMNRRELLLAAAAVAAPAALGLPSGAARGGTPLALVTADSEGRILAVRLTDLHVVRSLAVPHEPHCVLHS